MKKKTQQLLMLAALGAGVVYLMRNSAAGAAAGGGIGTGTGTGSPAFQNILDQFGTQWRPGVRAIANAIGTADIGTGGDPGTQFAGTSPAEWAHPEPA